MKTIGITGPIASGKSTVLKEFKNNKIDIFDSDSYVKILLNNNNLVKSLIIKEFPELHSQYSIKSLKSIIYSNYEKNISILENIIHPFVIKKIKREILIKKLLFKKLFVIEVPLLFESGLYKECNYIVLVTSSEETRTKRALQRSKIDIKDLKSIINKQISIYENKEKYINHVINTDKVSILDIPYEVKKIINSVK